MAIQLSRGLYQLPDAPSDVNNALAQAAKRVPNGVICLTSALAFHELTDTIPSRVWVAIGPKDWKPVVTSPAIQFVRFGPKVLNKGIQEHVIEGVSVRIYDPAKTIVDLFRYRRTVGELLGVGHVVEQPCRIDGDGQAPRSDKAEHSNASDRDPSFGGIQDRLTSAGAGSR